MIQQNEIKSKILLQDNDKYAEKKFYSKKLADKYYQCGIIDKSEKVKTCGNMMKFQNEKDKLKLEDNRKKLIMGIFCKDRFCPMCEWKKNRKVIREIRTAMQLLEEERKNKQSKNKLEYLHLTLTVRHPETNQLNNTIKLMNQAWKRMSESKRFEEAILGNFKALEIIGDSTQTGKVGPHFHILLIVKKEYLYRVGNKINISLDEWIDMWQKALRVDYKPSITIRKIVPKNDKWSKLESALAEVVKYSIKHSNLIERTNEDFKIIIDQIKNVRAQNTGGILKDKLEWMKTDRNYLNKTKEDKERWEAFEEEIYKWINGNYELDEIKDMEGNTTWKKNIEDK